MRFPKMMLPRRTGKPSPDLKTLYKINHIAKTFGVSFEEFEREPWLTLGRLSPEIQALWDREHTLLPAQLEIAQRWTEQGMPQPMEAPDECSSKKSRRRDLW